MTLRNLFDELNKWARTELDLTHDKLGAIQNKLKDLGGEVIGKGGVSIAAKFVIGGRAFVAKVAYYSQVDILTRKTIESNPILGQRYLRPLFASKQVAIQEYMRPLGDSRGMRAADIIGGSLRRHSGGSSYDVYRGNIGFCPRRRMVMIFDAQNW